MKDLKFNKKAEISLLFEPYFAIMNSWKMPTGSRDAAATETRIFFK
jgi:hypothetical protein